MVQQALFYNIKQQHSLFAVDFHRASRFSLL